MKSFAIGIETNNFPISRIVNFNVVDTFVMSYKAESEFYTIIIESGKLKECLETGKTLHERDCIVFIKKNGGVENVQR